MTRLVFDWSVSYRAAFLNGIGWNLLSMAIAFFLLRRSLGTPRAAVGVA